MRPTLRNTTPALLLLVLAVAGPSFAATTTKAPPKLTLTSLPEAVQKTVRAQTEGAVIRAISKEKGESGDWVYEIETKIKADGLGHDFIVGEDGALLISERQVKVESLPPAVKSTLLKAAGKSQILIVESVTKAGKLECYEAQVRAAKGSREVKVAPDGALMP